MFRLKLGISRKSKSFDYLISEGAGSKMVATRTGDKIYLFEDIRGRIKITLLLGPKYSWMLRNG